MFTSLDYQKSKLAGVPACRLLCVFRNPSSVVDLPSGVSAFAFRGHDLIEVGGGVSALVNCGGFPEAFDNAELSAEGLIRSHGRALAVQAGLRAHYPDAHHADCDVWAVFEAPWPD